MPGERKEHPSNDKSQNMLMHLGNETSEFKLLELVGKDKLALE